MDNTIDVQIRVREITKRLDGGIHDWKDNELYWCLKTLLLQADKIDRYEDLALEHHYQTILDEMEND